MPITVTRARQFLNDADGDNVADPGDTFLHTITVINGEATAATNLFLTESENGIAIDSGSFKIGPIETNDDFNSLYGTVQGNTPITFNATQLFVNDIDPDDPNPQDTGHTITRINGTSVVDGNGDPINVTVNVTNGSVTSNLDGTFTFKPTTGFEGAASFTYDSVDEDGVPSASATPATVSITVSDCVWYVDSTGGSDTVGVGDGSFTNPFASLTPLTSGGTSDGLDDSGDTIFVYANGANAYNAGIDLEDGQALRGEGSTSAYVVNGHTITSGGNDTQIEYQTFGAQVSNNNTIIGIDFVGENNGAAAIRDDGTAVGTLTVSNTEVAGTGQIIDVDNGGALNVRFDSVASTGSTGANGGVLNLSGVTGTFDVTGTTSITGSHAQNAIDVGGASTNVAVDFEGATTVTLTSATNGVNLGTNTGSTTFAGLDVTATSGNAFVGSSAGTLTITGSDNDLETATGQIFSLSGTAVGSGDLTFDSLTATGTVSGVQNAVELVNVDGNDITISNTVTIAGGGGDGINIRTDSSTNVAINSTTINNVTGDGIELNASTGSFSVNSGQIGNTNDPGAHGVFVTGGTGAVTIGATVNKSTAGDNVVEVTGHTGGTVDFNGNVTASGGFDNGILVNTNSGGVIRFDGGMTLSTGGNIAFSANNNGSAQLAVTDPGGANSGNDNNLTTTTGTALNVVNTTIHADDLNFESISKNGGSNDGIILNNTGSLGGLTITGNGAANSGGTIQNITGQNNDGIDLIDTSNFNATNLRIDNVGGYGIKAIDLGGSNSVANSHISDWNSDQTASATKDGISIVNDNTNMTAMIITNTLFDGSEINSATVTGNDGVYMEARGTSAMNLRVEDSTFTHMFGDGIQLSSIGGATGTVNVRIIDNDFTNSVPYSGGPGVGGGNGGISITPFGGTVGGASQQFTVLVQDNTLTDIMKPIATIGAIGGTSGRNVNADITIQNNTISNLLGGRGITFTVDGGDWDGKIIGNSVNTLGDNSKAAINVNFTDNNSPGFGTSGHGDVQILNNNVGNTGPLWTTVDATGSEAVMVTTQGASTMTALISGNNITANTPFEVLRARAGGTSNMNVTITNNTVSDTNGAHDEIDVSAGYISGQGGTILASVTGNTIAAGGDIELREVNSGTLNVTQASQAAVAAANGGTIVNITGTPQFGQATPPLPADPLLPPNFILAPPAEPGDHSLPDSDGGTPPADGGGTPPADDDTTPGTDTGGDTGTGGGDPVVPAGHELTQAELDTLVDAAIQRWADAGASAEQLAAMRSTTFSIADMAGTYLGTSTAGSVLVDSDGAGHGWFLDSTPGEDSEFDGSGSALKADAGGGADGKMDLLTVVMHELGHQVGLDDIYNNADADELMYGFARLSERRLPQADDLVTADMSHAGHESFIESSPSVASLPAGRGVVIQYTSTVLGNPNGLIGTPFTNFSKAETDNFPDALSANENLVVDTLTLGDTVYVDANDNGDFDAGEGVQNVTLTLYADTDSSGGFNAGDVAVAGATDITDANGNYSFTNLDAGNYIVVVDATNFDSGGALFQRLTIEGAAPDADTDITDGDDNGENALGGAVASKTITLAFNTEPTAGLGNDTNNTLDFGFILPNQAPVITSPATASGNEDTVIAVTGISIADVDAGTDPVKVTLTVAAGTLNVTVTTGLTITGAASGTLTLEGNLTDLNAGLASLGYTPVADYYGGPITLNINANDNGNNGPDPGVGDPLSEEDSATVAITVNAVADIFPDTVNLAEDAGATNLTGANDPLGNDTFENSGRAITAVSDPTNGTATIDDNSTVATNDDFIVYTPDADYNGADSFTYTVTSGGVTETETITVNLSAVNDEPTGTDDTITAIEDTFRTLSDTDFGFDDVDTGDVLSEVIITGVSGGSLYIDTGADGFDAGDAVSTFPATVTAAQLAGNLVAFKASDDANGAGIGEITFKVVDDSGAANDTSLADNTLIVDVTAVNDPPELTTTAGNTAFTEGENAASIPVVVDSGVTVDDVDSAIATATVEVTTGVGAEDVLAFVNDNAALYGNIAVTGGAGTDTISLASAGSTATLVQWQNALRAVTYTNTSDNPTVTDRVVTFTVNDGTDPSNSPTKTVTIAAADDDSSATGDSGTTTESGTVTIDVTANDNDPDGPPPSVTKIGTTNIAPGGTVTLSSGAKVTLELDGRLTYDPFGQFDDLAKFGQGASNDTDTDSFTYTLANGGVATVNITVQGQYSVPHVMQGTNGADNITGTVLDDIFVPGTGADTMTGSAGDDSYTIDNVGDLPVEAFGQGDDTVFTTLADYALHKNIENLVLLSGAVDGTGNQLENGILGNDDANILNGLGGADLMAGEGGDDTYIVQNSADEAVETSALDGHDTVMSSAGAFTLGAFVEDLILTGAGIKGTGNGLDNVITGNSRGNLIDGKAGADTMTGAQGDDTYTVDNLGDEVIELSDGGVDTVKSSVSFRLGDGVNHLELTGTAANGSGNNLSNIITGNASANILKGVNGNDRLTGGGNDDTLYGGAGNDVLRGDGGADSFYFDARLDDLTNVDTIDDYSVLDDTIFLNRSYFKGLASGTLNASAFHTGAAAGDASDRIIYDSATGNLYYDSDGTGADAQILFAKLDTGLALTNADFILYS